MQVTASHHRIWIAFLSIILIAMVSACREDEEETLPAASDQATPAAAAPDTWLEISQDETPLSFLSRVTGTPPDRIAGPLDRAIAAYEDSPRMIANRSAQLWNEISQKDDPPVPIETLLDQLAVGGKGVTRSVGPVIQHYRTMRGQGVDHATAISAAAVATQTP